MGTQSVREDATETLVKRTAQLARNRRRRYGSFDLGYPVSEVFPSDIWASYPLAEIGSGDAGDS